jgi:hypothetical protein
VIESGRSPLAPTGANGSAQQSLLEFDATGELGTTAEFGRADGWSGGLAAGATEGPAPGAGAEAAASAAARARPMDAMPPLWPKVVNGA